METAGGRRIDGDERPARQSAAERDRNVARRRPPCSQPTIQASAPFYAHAPGRRPLLSVAHSARACLSGFAALAVDEDELGAELSGRRGDRDPAGSRAGPAANRAALPRLAAGGASPDSGIGLRNPPGDTRMHPVIRRSAPLLVGETAARERPAADRHFPQ